MQPGLSRAIPLGVIGFMTGALITLIIRGLQGLDPVWDAEVGFVLSFFMSAGFFVWGMGAFNPAMSVHGEDAHAEPEPETALATTADAAAEEDLPPARLLGGSIWQLATWLIIFLVIVGGFAILPGGLALTTTVDPDASVAIAGFFDVETPFGVVPVSQFTLFVVFIAFTFASLYVAAAGLGYVVVALNRGLVESRKEAAEAAAEPALGSGAVARAALPAGAGADTSAEPAAAAAPPAWIGRARTLATFAVTFVVLYLIFYYVAIGLILPAPQLPGLTLLFPDPGVQLVALSAINAALFALILLRPMWVLRAVGIGARWLSRVLRQLPEVLFQRSN